MLARTLIVAFGSALGGVGRYWAGLFAARFFPEAGPLLPWDTIAVNISGSFLIGTFSVIFASEYPRLFFLVGVCGGFTTFSSFSLQTFQLLSNGKLSLAGINVAASVLLCLLGTALGVVFGRAIQS